MNFIYKSRNKMRKKYSIKIINPTILKKKKTQHAKKLCKSKFKYKTRKILSCSRKKKLRQKLMKLTTYIPKLKLKIRLKNLIKK